MFLLLEDILIFKKALALKDKVGLALLSLSSQKASGINGVFAEIMQAKKNV